MARPVWAGVPTFGLVALPVMLYTAANDHTMHFHQQPRRARVGRSTKKRRSTRGDLDFLAAQLYEQVAYPGIPGRSGMNYDELQDAAGKSPGAWAAIP